MLAQIKLKFTTMVKQKRKSAKVKAQLVLELLRGKPKSPQPLLLQ